MSIYSDLYSTLIFSRTNRELLLEEILPYLQVGSILWQLRFIISSLCELSYVVLLLFQLLKDVVQASTCDIALLDLSACWKVKRLQFSSICYPRNKLSSHLFPFPQGESVKYFLDNLDRIGQLVRHTFSF